MIGFEKSIGWCAAVLALAACSGDQGDDVEPTDQPVDTSETGTVVDTVDTSNGETADTAEAPWWPDGLYGAPADPPQPPMTDFEVLDIFGDPVGPSDLYGQRTVLLFTPGSGDSVSDTVTSDFDDLRGPLSVVDVKILAVTWQTPAINLSYSGTIGINYQIWSDDDGVLYDYYGVQSQLLSTEIRLLDENGNVLVIYDRMLVDSDTIGLAQHVVDDAELLWGEGTTR